MQTESLLLVTKNLFSHLENLPRLLKEVMLEAKKLTNAQCCSVFLYNERLKQLVAKVFDGDVPHENEAGLSDVRFPIGLGIAGYVASTNQLLNVDDAYSHPLFYIGIDEMTGFKTRNILCFPLKNAKGDVIGVAELCNKIGGGPFTKFDEEIAEAFSVYCSISVLHSLLYDGAQKAALRFRLANEMMVYHMKVTDEDVQGLTDSVVPTPSRFLANMDSFCCIPRDISVDDTPLAVVSMFHDLGFVTRHQIFPDRLARFVLMVKKGYRDPPYHNWLHAFAVTHFCYLLLKNIKWEKFITNIEAFALFLACLGHDIDHRGTTNSYQKVSGSALADLYSSEGSMLERHHYAQTQSIINTAGCDILMNLSTEDYATTLDIIQILILGTDVAEHLKAVEQMERMASEGYDQTKVEHRLLLLRLLMTACDLSDQTKNFKNSRMIAECIYSEFFCQGDLEKRMGTDPGELMDRDKAVIPTLQINFLDSVALPVYRILSKILEETKIVLDAVENNRQMWFRANERLIERNLPRNMEAFRYLDSLDL
jgi:cGMP-dependent 3',5'-cyclic phosphodiesterase